MTKSVIRDSFLLTPMARFAALLVASVLLPFQSAQHQSASSQAVQGHHVMHHFPQWSPDGATILASSTADGDAEIFLFPVDGGPPRKLTDNTSLDDAARWSRDGRLIYFVSDRRGRPEPFVMNADGTEQGPGPPADPSDVHPSGWRVLEASEGGRGVIAVVSPAGARRLLPSQFHAEQPSLSPSGSSIVYEERTTADGHDVQRSNIVVCRLDGSDHKILAQGTDPSWSPDGLLIAFKTWSESDRQLWIATVRPDGTGFRRLDIGVHPAWSPDSQRLAFMRDDGTRTDIWIMHADGSNRQCITCRF